MASNRSAVIYLVQDLPAATRRTIKVVMLGAVAAVGVVALML